MLGTFFVIMKYVYGSISYLQTDKAFIEGNNKYKYISSKQAPWLSSCLTTSLRTENATDHPENMILLKIRLLSFKKLCFLTEI